MLPMPTPTPASAMTARPAPSCLAEPRSIISVPFVGYPNGCLVEVDSVMQVDAGEHGEDVGLQRGHQQFEADEHDIDGEGERGGEQAQKPGGAEHDDEG